MSETLTGCTEENVLCLLVWSDSHAPTLAAILPPEIFGVRAYQRIARAAIDYISRFHHAPRIHIRDRLEAEINRGGGEAQSINHTLDAMERLATEIQPHFVLAELDRWIRLRKKINAVDEAYKALQRGDEEAADEAIYRRDAFQVNTDVGTWLHDTDLSFMEHRTSDEFSIGIEALDRKGVCPSRKTLTVFIAPKKAGKSWSCVNLAKANVIMHRRKVLHISLENSAALTKRRYVQAFYSMTAKQALDEIEVPVFGKTEKGEWESTHYEKITPLPLLIDNKDEIVRRLDSLRNRAHVLIKEFPTGTLTPAQLYAYMDRLEREYDFIPDLLIADYPTLMRSTASNRRLDIISNYTAIRTVCVERNMAGYAPAQSNRYGETASILKGRDIAEAYDLNAVADTILTFCRTPQEKAKMLARISVDAARDQEDSFLVMIAQNYSIGQFCLDSVLMNPAIMAELNRIEGKDTNDEESEG
jgi:replicative DNA helicase